MAQPRKQENWVPSVCYMCFNACGIKVRQENGVVVEIKGDEDNPNSLGRLCAKSRAGIMGMYNPNRVKVPLKRTNPHKGIGVDPQWQEITWEEALEAVIERMKKIRAEDPRKLIVSEMDFPVIPQFLAFSSAFGTPNTGWNGAGFYCGNGLHPVMYLTHGTFYSEVDLDYCNYCLFFGSQAGFMSHINAVRAARRMADARERGMRLVVIDPVSNNAGAKADEWIPIRPGTDAALALSMMNVLINELSLYDAQFLKKYTNAPYLVGPQGYYVRDKESKKPLVVDSTAGKAQAYDAQDLNIDELALEGEYDVDGQRAVPSFQLLKEHLKKYPPEQAAAITTVPAETIRRLAREFGEAARIGSKIVIEGKELPFRPVCVDYSRGPIAHKHAMLTGLAIQLLNLVVGAIGVPGGQLGLNSVGPGGHGLEEQVGPEGKPLSRPHAFSATWTPKVGPDGFLVAPDPILASLRPYPPNDVKAPNMLELRELCPVAAYGRPMALVSQLDLDKYRIPYQPEMMIHSRTNIMMTQGSPKVTEQVLKSIPFIVTFAVEVDETVEMADIVLPDSHFLERLDPFPNHPCCWIEAASDDWYWEMRQPVVDPPGQVRNVMEVLLGLAERLDFTPDYNVMLNAWLGMKDPFKLDREKKYNWEEIADMWAKSLCGPEHDLAWFKKHGFLKYKRNVEEKYPRPFISPRIHIYFEYFKKCAEDIKRVTDSLGIPWDISDYQPLPDWKGCAAHEDTRKDYDLFVVNYKLPYHTFSYTAENPWLCDLSEHHVHAHKILLNSEVADKKGIQDGDTIWVESDAGKVKGTVKVTECIHPEALGIGGVFGHWAKRLSVARDKGTHFNSLLPVSMDRIDPVSTGLDACIKVKVYKA